MSLILSGTDGLSDVDGTAATPAIRGTDANTGIFFGTDIIGFSEGGAEVARFDSSGNFGLGVTPSAWQVNNRAIQIYEGWGSISANNSQGCCDVSANCFNTGSAAITGWKYTNSSALASLYQQSAGVHKWLTAPSGTAGNVISFTQAMTLNANGALALQGASTSANGVGITFPATVSASSNANTLDDYEEGTWTPVDGSGAGLSFTVSDARYTKIGRMVQCFAQITYPTTSNGSNASISGLPFTMATTVGGAYGAFTVYTTEPTASTWLNLTNTTTSNAYALGGASATNATFSTDQFRLVWIYEV